MLKIPLLSDYVKTNIYRNAAVVVSYFRTYSKQTHTERTSKKQYSSVQIKLAMAMRFSSITVAIICSVDLFQSTVIMASSTKMLMRPNGIRKYVHNHTGHLDRSWNDERK